MKVYSLLLILFIIPFQISNCQEYCEFIHKVQSYQSSVKLQHVRGEYDSLDSTTFNLRLYLNFFDHLNASKNMKIGVCYMASELEGKPYLYAIKKNQKLEKEVGIPSEKVMKKKNAKYTSSEYRLLYYFLKDSTVLAKNNVIPENSEVGFLQYLFFSEMGEQFALKWHSNYRKKYVICSKVKFDEIIHDLKSDGGYFRIDSASIENLNKYNPEIITEVKEDSYNITWTEYFTHSGIYKCTYQINRNHPYQITLSKSEVIANIYTDFCY